LRDSGLGGGDKVRKTRLERFLKRVSPCPITGCWWWTGFCDGWGYGRFHSGVAGMVPAHRWAHMHFIGPIPAGLEVDHLCKQPSCVNPAHLEAVTGTENRRRANGFAMRNARKTLCIRGHSLSGSNLYIPKTGGRKCRACHALHAASERRRRSVERAAATTNGLTSR
jgi:hypothetical protein